ncbi:hypothetical protein CASFOL_023678 [Castilleja foliolosa]|uniref:Uncharacterized protein n=1 Tax=Castilleja foliolosa TaxID=1961234 RepID=A0ABD3CNE4_9LAMI
MLGFLTQPGSWLLHAGESFSKIALSSGPTSLKLVKISARRNRFIISLDAEKDIELLKFPVWNVPHSCTPNFYQRLVQGDSELRVCYRENGPRGTGLCASRY